MWKLLCNDSDAEYYLDNLSDAIINLLTGDMKDNGGQWHELPWPILTEEKNKNFQA